MAWKDKEYAKAYSRRWMQRWRANNPEKARQKDLKDAARQRPVALKCIRIRGWVKKFHGCIDCGYNKNPDALHFDHIDPSTKKCCPGTMPTNSWKTWFDETAKCVVRCANCHAIRSAQQRRNGCFVKRA